MRGVCVYRTLPATVLRKPRPIPHANNRIALRIDFRHSVLNDGLIVKTCRTLTRQCPRQATRPESKPLGPLCCHREVKASRRSSSSTRDGIGNAARVMVCIRLDNMTRTRSLLSVGAAVLVSLPVPAPMSAQGPMLFEAYAARKEQPVNPTFGGLGFNGYTGIF